MRLQTKILAVSLPLAIASSILVAIAARRATETLMVRELGGRLRPQAEDFAAGLAKDLEARRESALLGRLQAAQAFAGAAFAEALLPDGTVAAHTNVLEAGKKREDADARRAIASATTEFAREAGPRGPLLVLSTPVWRADEEFLLSGGPRKRLGTLRLGIPLAATIDSARRVSGIVAALTVGYCLLALALSLALMRYVLRPLGAIGAATARVAAGDYGAQVPVLSQDELGELAQAFNRMGATLSRTVVSRDRLEEALAIARATLEASADGILVVDRNLVAVTYNRRFVEMWGITEEVMRSGDVRKMAEFVMNQTEDPESFLRLATGSNWSDEQERRDMIRLKDGRVFDRISQAYRIGGQTMGRTITTRDLTLHLEGVRALSQARDEAVETARVKSQFLANVSHELRTPLNAVIGSSELLTMTKLDREQKEHVGTLERAARTLLDLVDGVLDFSKIEAGRMTVERTPLRLAALIADAAALVAPRAAEKGLKLRADAGEAGSWELLGDPTRLRQVLLNLLANAVKFTEKGEVAVDVHVVSRGEAAVDLEFGVRDTGVGIPPDQARRLFAPFTQGDGSTTRRYGGTGLGLAISKSLVELMGGEIGFNSEPGRGTRFWFRVRLDRADAPDTAGPAVPVAAGGRRDRIRALVVEDNEINRRLIERQLERLGCPCDAVGDGRSALDALATDEYGIVLLDCQMPGLDGYATAQEIRRREAGKKRTPVVAITANATEDDRRKCLDAGMDDFVPKPVTLDQLAAALERWDKPFDETALGVFASLAADAPGALTRLLEDFLEDSAARLKASREALAKGDHAACSREAHGVKGAAASVGARGLRELCRRVEKGAKLQPPAPDLAALLDQADAEIERLRAASGRRSAA